MLDVTRRNPIALTSKGRVPLPTPRAEPLVGVPPLLSQLHQSQKRLHHQRNSPLCQDEDHWQPWLFHFVGGCVWLTPTRAGELGHKHTPGSPTGLCLLGVPIGDHITFSSEWWSMMWVPVPDSYPDIPDPGIPTIGPAWTPRLMGLLSTDQGSLNECNALYLTHEQKWPEMCCEFIHVYYWCK